MMAGVACGSCGSGLREDAKFCHECGAPTAASGVAQYKQVTVLFADVVRSMDIAAALDIERWRDVITEIVRRSAAVVRRYGGTAEYNGDGVMALFGAPVALEDHAFRACLAALAIQDEANRVAADVQRRDDVALRLRVGLNSGQLIAGETGAGSPGYRASGEAVGMAQRMESVAPPGGVMLSESTALLVEHAVLLGEPEQLHIKGTDEPVRARRLVAIGPRDRPVGGAEASLVGRGWEMAALEAIVERAIGGRGGVVNVVGPAGIGKTRVAREAAALTAGRGVEVVWSSCESHASDVPFHAVRRLLRAVSGLEDLGGAHARDRVRERIANADPQDLLLLDDLLGIGDRDVPLPQVDPETRRRRLTALINTASLARTEPALFLIEDAHWIDSVSESVLADLLTVIPQTKLVVLITSRPEYDGVLQRLAGAHTIALAPLGDSDTAALLSELLGSDPSVGELAPVIAERAGGNPFFAEEMVRELVQRGVLAGEHGGYVCRADVAEVSVPATVQAAIAARLDRLSAPAKQTMNAASVIGARFGAELLAALGIDPVFDELLNAELVDQVRFTPHAEYAVRHPLIRAVAYESQLKSDRAQWHRRVAAAIQERAPDAVEENAALIAEHLQSAGEPRASYGWHMRAAAWLTNHNVGAARLSWERACRIADALPVDDPDQMSMRIAPRTMLCVTGWQAIQGTSGRFAELRELCDAAEDKMSLAVGMSGLATELLFAGRSREGSRLVSEQMALLESIGDPAPTIGMAFIAFNNWFDSGEFGQVLRWTQTVIDLAEGDPTKGAGFGFGSPLAAALAWRGVARWWLGRPGWRRDLDDAAAMARTSDPTTLAMVVNWTHGLAISHGVIRADDTSLHVIEEAAHTAAGTADPPVSVIKYALAVALLNRDAVADRRRGLEIMMQAHDMWLHEPVPFLIPLGELWIGREEARGGDYDAAIPIMRKAVDDLHRAERPFFGVLGIRLLVETLLERGSAGDQAEAHDAMEWLANLASAGPDQAPAMCEITLLRLRALLARARGGDDAYPDLVHRYRVLAESLGFDGHIAWAETMGEGNDRGHDRR